MGNCLPFAFFLQYLSFWALCRHQATIDGWVHSKFLRKLCLWPRTKPIVISSVQPMNKWKAKKMKRLKRTRKTFAVVGRYPKLNYNMNNEWKMRVFDFIFVFARVESHLLTQPFIPLPPCVISLFVSPVAVVVVALCQWRRRARNNQNMDEDAEWQIGAASLLLKWHCYHAHFAQWTCLLLWGFVIRVIVFCWCIGSTNQSNAFHLSPEESNEDTFFIRFASEIV